MTKNQRYPGRPFVPRRVAFRSLVSRLLALVALVALAAACTPQADDAPRPGTAQAQVDDPTLQGEGPSPYSPWAVHLADHETFHLITFKDVGMSLFGDDRTLLYEALAQSVAMQMTVLPDPKWRADLIHDAAFADPANHLACESEHIYVDVWTGETPNRWGYSLWSGCGEDDQFVWEELNSPLDVNAPTVESVESLAERIVERLEDAEESGCFTRHC